MRKLIQCRQIYFVANKTTMNQALTIVFVQKFHIKRLNFCILKIDCSKFVAVLFIILLNIALGFANFSL